DLRRTFEAREARGPLRDLLLHEALLLLARERALERLFGRGLEAPLAAPVEIHRRRLQPHQDAGGFHGYGIPADVVARELLEPELRALAALPEEIGVERIGEAARTGEQLGARRPLEGKHDARRLDLRAPAVRALDLVGRRRGREHGADLELALLLVEHVHGA